MAAELVPLVKLDYEVTPQEADELPAAAVAATGDAVPDEPAARERAAP